MDGSPARAIDGAGVDREVKAGGGWRGGDGGWGMAGYPGASTDGAGAGAGVRYRADG